MTSSSVKSLSATTLTLIGRSSGCASAASRPSSTCASESRRGGGEKGAGGGGGGREEAGGGERVERDVDALEPRAHEVVDLAREQVAVRGEGEVVDRLDPRDHLDEPPQLAPHERLP